jgi:hypothetical protein
MVFKRKPKQKGGSVDQQPAQKIRTSNQNHPEVIAKDKVIRSTAPTPRNGGPHDRDVTEDLVRRVGAALDEWAAVNGLNAIPRNIIFQQALSILNAVDRNLTPKK